MESPCSLLGYGKGHVVYVRNRTRQYLLCRKRKTGWVAHRRNPPTTYLSPIIYCYSCRTRKWKHSGFVYGHVVLEQWRRMRPELVLCNRNPFLLWFLYLFSCHFICSHTWEQCFHILGWGLFLTICGRAVRVKNYAFVYFSKSQWKTPLFPNVFLKYLLCETKTVVWRSRLRYCANSELRPVFGTLVFLSFFQDVSHEMTF